MKEAAVANRRKSHTSAAVVTAERGVDPPEGPEPGYVPQPGHTANQRSDRDLIVDREPPRLGNGRAAALYAVETLTLPVNSSTRGRFSDITRVLNETK